MTVHEVSGVVERLDCSSQDGSEANVEFEAILLQNSACKAGLLDSYW